MHNYKYTILFKVGGVTLKILLKNQHLNIFTITEVCLGYKNLRLRDGIHFCYIHDF